MKTWEMIKIIGNAGFNHESNHYDFNLENGDQISIREEDYDRIMVHQSVKGNKYIALVNENEHNDNLPIVYIGFKLQ